MVHRGAIDGESFRTYVEKVLLPTPRPGDTVVMDNLGSHKGGRQTVLPAEILTRPEPHGISLYQTAVLDIDLNQPQ